MTTTATQKAEQKWNELQQARQTEDQKYEAYTRAIGQHGDDSEEADDAWLEYEKARDARWTVQKAYEDARRAEYEENRK